MQDYEYHPLSRLFPMMDEREYAELVADIRANGQREPITRYLNSTTGIIQVLDGRNRYRACRDLAIEPKCVDFEGSDADAEAFVISANLVRRHLTETQRAMVAARLANLRSGQRADQVRGVPFGTAAAKLNVSKRSAIRARKVIEKGSPELVAAVERGKIAVSAAERQIEAAPIGTADANGNPKRKGATPASRHEPDVPQSMTFKEDVAAPRSFEAALDILMRADSDDLWIARIKIVGAMEFRRFADHVNALLDKINAPNGARESTNR